MKKYSLFPVVFVLMAMSLSWAMAQDTDTEDGTSDTGLSVLQINFTFDMTAAEYEDTVAPLAEAIADVEGLLWKVWVINDEDKVAGGIYLFDKRASIDAYLSSDIVAMLASNPQITNIDVKVFAVMESVSAITRAPLMMESEE